ncbi:MAG TPA: DNA starvation/stationary phase protection protein [Dehalococcoidia bacterium]|nr:DNA starvation/stationary phase protection protein [Dehalococcoidia bacterium]
MVTATKSGVMECLKHAQANAVTLYLNNKRYHWYTYGQHFRDLHLFFDEMASSAFAEIDPLGERIRMLGGDPLSDLGEIRQWVTIQIASGEQSPRQMLEEALANERRVIDEMRTGAILADEQRDPGSNDLFSTLVQNHEKYAWFIAETLRQDGSMGA